MDVPMSYVVDLSVLCILGFAAAGFILLGLDSVGFFLLGAGVGRSLSTPPDSSC